MENSGLMTILVRMLGAVVALGSIFVFTISLITFPPIEQMSNLWFASTVMVHLLSLIGLAIAGIASVFLKRWAQKLMFLSVFLALGDLVAILASFALNGAPIEELFGFVVSISNCVGFVILPFLGFIVCFLWIKAELMVFKE